MDLFASPVIWHGRKVFFIAQARKPLCADDCQS